MKIIHVIESSGGSADFVLYLAKYLNGHDHAIIHSNRTFAGRFEAVQKQHPAVRFIHWKNAQREIKVFQDLKATISLLRVLRTLTGDVIHLHSSKAGFIGRIVCFILRRRAVIYTPNGLAFLRKDVTKRKRNIYIALEKFAAMIGGEVIACSRSEANALINHGIRSNYINNGTPITTQVSNIPDTVPFIIGTTGRLTIQKNPEMFNRIASHFEHDSRFRFTWVGDGELRELIKAKNIEVTGWVTRDTVRAYIAQANLYLSTALWEGLPFAVIEAMDLGKPLLLTNCVGNVDLVNDNGFLFNTETEAIEKILRLQADRNLLGEFATRSKELVKKQFDVEQMAKAYLRAYQKLQP